MTKDSSKRKTPSNPATHYCLINSPVGKLLLAGDHTQLMHIAFQEGKHPLNPHPDWKNDKSLFHMAIQQLDEYFSGQRKTFSIPLALQGTPFQLTVWQALQTIPYGITASYGDIAKIIGHHKASRAVGAANGQNPLSIMVPCHRVIGSTGKLVGYGGGLSIKEKLLSLETRYADSMNRPLAEKE